MKARIAAAGLLVAALVASSSADDVKSAKPEKGEAWAEFSVPGMT